MVKKNNTQINKQTYKSLLRRYKMKTEIANKKVNEIYQDTEHDGVYRMKISRNRFVEIMGGEVTLWSIDSLNGELTRPQTIRTELLEQLNTFMEATK